jgi:hypothetical protein
MFGLDEMHLFGHGISYQLVCLMKGSLHGKKVYLDGGFYLGEGLMGNLFKTMAGSIHPIPPTFDGSFSIPFGKSTTRAVDWIDIARFAIPVLMVPRLPDDQAKMAVLDLVTFMQISLKKEIDSTQLGEMERSKS